MADSAGQSAGEGEPDWFSVSRAAHLTGCSRRTVRRWCSNGDVVAEKDGRQWMIRADTLPRNGRTKSPDTNPPDPETADMTDRVAELSERCGRLQARLEQAQRELPSGEREKINRMEKVLQKVAYTPFARYLIPADLREELTANS